MFVATVIVSTLFTLVLFGSAAGKATRHPEVISRMVAVGVPENRVSLLAIPQFAGAVGLVVGLWIAPIGIVAAACLVLYFVLAIVAHLRAGDRGFGPAAGLVLFAAAALALRIISA